MEPERRLIERLNNKGAADDDEARQQYHEHCRPITGVDEAVVKPAYLATGRQTEEPMEQLASAIARASAHQPGKQRRHRRKGALFRHEVPRKSRNGQPLPPRYVGPFAQSSDPDGLSIG